MNRISKVLGSLFVSAALLVGSGGLAAAEEPEEAAQVAEAIESVAPVDAALATSAESGDGLAFTVVDSSVKSPATSADPVVMDAAGTQTVVTLPVLDGSATSMAQASDDTVVYVGSEEVSLAVQPLADGSTRFLTILDGKEAAQQFEYRFEGAELDLQSDGSVLVYQEGALTGVVDVSWAKDANGVDVPTHYETEGDALIQVIDHASGNYAYPVVADPWWNPLTWKWKKIGRATVSGLKKCGLGALGISGGVVGANVAVNVGRTVAGKYLVSIYGGPYMLIGVAAAGCVGNLL